MRAPASLRLSLVRVGVLAFAALTAASATQAQTTINNQTVTVPPSSIPSGDDLFVGTTGTGVLNILSGGAVTTDDTALGQTAPGIGTVNVTGGTWTNTGGLDIGLDGTGTLNISAGGVVTTSLGAAVGDNAGSNGTVTLTGAGSTWTDSSSVTIGGQGTGSMTVSAGGVLNTGNVYVGSSEGSSGIFTLTGAGSEVNLSSSLYVGDDGNGTFNVTDGATLAVSGGIYVSYAEGQGLFNVSGGSTVTSGDAAFGYYSDNGKGTANISGAGTTWAIDGDLRVGDEGGAGEVNITDGAQVSVTGDLEMGMYDEGITRGDILVSGANSQLIINGDATIGDERPGIVAVSNGALFQIDGTTYIAVDDTAPSSVSITGTGSQFTAGDIYIGDSSGASGTLTVAGGAHADTGDVYLGNASGSTATLNVSGATTLWEGGPSFYVGYDGTGTMNITDGMKFDSSNPVNYFYLGYNGANSAGTVNVSGAGTEVYVDNYVTVGGAGIGTFNVTAGAYVTADYLYGADGAGGGEMLVSGAGSTFNADYGAYIGYSGNFNVLVTDGGLLSASSTSLQIGYGSGTTAAVEVSNGGQVWSGQGIIVGGQGDGTLTLSTGASATANYMTIAAQAGSTGTLIFGAAASDPAVAAGTLSVPTVAFGIGSGEIVFNHTSDLTFVPTVGGSGAISVLSGMTTFSTDSATFTGDVDVTGGKAVFNALLPGDVTVSGSGIVGGSGTIASLDVQSGGTVAPGNSPGTLNVTGNVSFASGSNYDVEVAGAVSDLILASGTSTLTGGTVQVSGSPTLMRYAILTSTGARTGEFDGVESTSAFIDYSLDYDPNNVYLVIDGYNSLAIAARTPNQFAVAQALDQFPTDNPLYSAIIGGSIAGAQQAFNALSGEIHASVGTALADDNRYVREAITGRLIQAYYGGVGAGGGQPIVLAAAAPTDVATVDTSSRMSLGSGYGAASDAPAGGHNLAYWSRAFGAWGQYDSNGNAATTDRDLGGFITGVDGALGGGWRAGLATGYMYTGLDADARFSSAQINSYVLGGYAGGALGHGFALRSGGTWTWNDIDTARSVIFPGFFEAENANYNGNVGQLFGELAYPIFTHGGVVEPFAGLAYVHVGTGGFTESGPVAGLTSGGLDMNFGYGTLGARAGTTVVWGGTTLIPHASLAWQYAFGDTTPQQALAFASAGIGMGIGGVPLAQNSALMEVGADVLVGADATLGLSYMGQYAGDVQDNGLRGRFNWRY